MEDNGFLHDNKIETLMSRNESGVKDAISSAFISTTDLFYDMVKDSQDVDNSSDGLLTDLNTYNFGLESLLKSTSNQTKSFDSLLDGVSDIKLVDVTSISKFEHAINSIGDSIDTGPTLNTEQIRESYNDDRDNNVNIETIVDLLDYSNRVEAGKRDVSDGKNSLQKIGGMIKGVVGTAGDMMGKAGNILGGGIGQLLSFIPGVGPVLGGVVGPLLGGVFGIIGKALPGLAVIAGSVALLGKLFGGDESFFFKASEPFFDIVGDMLKEQVDIAVAWISDKISRNFQWMTTTSVLMVSNTFSMIGDFIKWKVTGVTTSTDTNGDGVVDANDIFTEEKLTKGVTSWVDAVFGEDGGVGWFGRGRYKDRSMNRNVDWGDYDKSKGTNLTSSGMDRGRGAAGSKPVYGGDFNLSRYQPDDTVSDSGEVLTKTPITDLSGFGENKITFTGSATRTAVLTDSDDSPDTLLLSPGDHPDVRDMNLGPKANEMSGYILKAFQDELGDTYQPYITSGRRAPTDPNAATKSKHISGEAIDLMTRYYPGGPQISFREINKIGTDVSQYLGDEYNVLYHEAGSGYHFHIAYRPEARSRNTFDMSESRIPSSQWASSSPAVPTQEIYKPLVLESSSNEEEVDLSAESQAALVYQTVSFVKQYSDEYTTTNPLPPFTATNPQHP